MHTSVQLGVEQLESRTLLSAGLNETFVASLYQGVLHRNVDAAGLAYWAGGLNAGTMNRTQVAVGIFSSDAARAVDVDQQYVMLLGRHTDTAGANFWAQVMRDGATREQVEASIAGSDEYFRHAGGDNFDFLNTLYQLQLGRPLDEAGRVFFGTQLAQGASRTDVAQGITQSGEAAGQTIREIYKATLNRDPDPAGSQFWMARITGDRMPYSEVAGNVAGSDEFTAAIQARLAGTNTDDPNAAAAAINQATGRFGTVGAVVTGPEQTGTVIVNNVTLSPADLQNLEQRLRALSSDGVGVHSLPSRFWYDPVSGAAGLPGEGTEAFLPAGLQLGGPLPADASNGTSGVFVNGRQITTNELAFLQKLVGTIPAGRYFIRANGDAGPEGGNVAVNLIQLAHQQGQRPPSSVFSTYDLTGISVLGDGNFIGVLGNDFTWTSE
jgi:hypothetical protein